MEERIAIEGIRVNRTQRDPFRLNRREEHLARDTRERTRVVAKRHEILRMLIRKFTNGASSNASKAFELLAKVVRIARADGGLLRHSLHLCAQDRCLKS